jgi:beta,beta-carotene 9',10'-dioxygenase
MLYRFAFTGGRVAYANRYLRSRSYLEPTATGRISRGEFATDPCRTLFQPVAAWFSPKFTDNCNVNVNKVGQRGCRPRRNADADSLRPGHAEHSWRIRL